MDAQKMFSMFPGIQPDELLFIQHLTSDMTEAQQQQFVSLYSGRRKEQQTLLIMTLLGFVGFAGIQRFVVGEIGMGILFFFTGGFCCIGTIIDLINIGTITSRYNQKQAGEVAHLVMLMTK